MQVIKLLDSLPKTLTKLLNSPRLEEFKSQNIRLDAVELLARTSEEYEEWLADLQKIGEELEQHERRGAKLTYIKLSKDIQTQLGYLSLIGLREPEQNKVYEKFGLIRLVVFAPDISTTETALANAGIPLTKQINYIQFEQDSIFIQIHGKSLSEEVIKRNEPMTDSQTIVKLQEEIGMLTAKLSELETEKEAKLQIMADFQNYRKRMEKERASFGLMSNIALVNDVLDVVDDVKRTIADEEKDLTRAQTMFNIIQDKLLAAVGKLGLIIVEVNPGDMFDANFMEAIGTVSVAEVDEHNKVVAVVQPGYRYQDSGQLMRMAKVIVGKKDRG